jgi:catechol 2,3-dioxygenase-like lactoylglutathione lyase family enzyme
MTDFGFVLLYVDNPPASATFYERLLGHPPIETSPTFAMLPLRDGVMLGLWSRHTVEPRAGASGANGEMAFTVEDASAVRATHDSWRDQGISIAQTPTEMDFGHTFVGLDPDGHRLRVFAPAARS